MPRTLAAVLLCLTCVVIPTPTIADTIPCWKVRAAIAWAGSVSAAEALARQHGYSAGEIAEARKCLKR